MSTVQIQTDDKDIVIGSGLVITAKIFSGKELEDGFILEPKGMSLSRYLRDPIVTRGVGAGSERVGKCDSVVLSKDGKAVIAVISFDGSDLGMNAHSWFKKEILWSFVIKVDINKSGSTLLNLGIDRYAPII